MTDKYSHWRDNLAGKITNYTMDPEVGFYRKRTQRGGPFVPVAIFEENGKLVCLVDGERRDPDDVWTHCCNRPISEETYRAVQERGEPWPDDHPIAPSGRNEPEDPVELLRDQIASARADLADYAAIQSDLQASQAQSLRSRLLELSREADKIRETEKRPHFEAAKAVDAKFMPLVKDAKDGAEELRRSMSTYETAKARAAAAKARELEEAERKRLAEIRKAEEAGKPIPAAALAEPEPPPPPTTQIRPGYGRAAAVRVKHVVTGITDFGAVANHYRHSLEPHLIALAQKEIDAGFTVPGVSVEEQRRVA